METTDTIAAKIAASRIPTTLFLGAGASIPSGALSGTDLARHLTEMFFRGDKPRELADIAGRVELKFGRQELIKCIRSLLDPITPSETLLNLPNFNFASIFTTNYDLLVERAFEKAKIELPIVRSNKDFSFDYRQHNTIFYKLHGCVTEDRADGRNYGIIITDEDYTTYKRYRQTGFQQLEQSLLTSNVVFVGYSMADSNIKQYVDQAIALAGAQQCPGQAFLILYEEDEIEARRWENRGLGVAYGDLDRLLVSLATVKQNRHSVSIFSPISNAKKYVIAASISSISPLEESGKLGNIKKVISGSPVTYADIKKGSAFGRSASDEIVHQVAANDTSSVHVLLGPSGSGKTSAGRLSVSGLLDKGFVCYEHKPHVGVDFPTWQDIEREHHRKGERACLFLDEPNASQFAVNQLASYVLDGQGCALSLIITYHPSIWSYRTKSAALVKKAQIHSVARLTPTDIKRIAIHVKRSPEISSALSLEIQSMTQNDLVQTLTGKAKSDLFVSLKYLFETRSLDEIVLKEFDQLGRGKPKDIQTDIRSLYATVALLEACGRHVHRQMVLRMVDIDAMEIGALLDYLDGTVFESERDDSVGGIYQWSTRHPRIASIIASSKFSQSQRKKMLERIIQSINPTSKIERQFCAYLCNSDIGIESLPLIEQTELYGLLCEVVPAERVPRHRLIRNLIHQKKFGEAEIAISEARGMNINDSVIYKYDVLLDVGKAESLEFLDQTDKLNLLESAVAKATTSLSRRPDDMYTYENLCRASLALVQCGGDLQTFELALDRLKRAYVDLGDFQMTQWIGKYESEAVRLRSKATNSGNQV